MILAGIRFVQQKNTVSISFVDFKNIKNFREVASTSIPILDHTSKTTYAILSTIKKFNCSGVAVEIANFNPELAISPMTSNPTLDRLIFMHSKAFCLQRSNYKSELSGNRSKTLQAHHIIPRSKNGSHHPSNIIMLTPQEHMLIHQEKLSIPDKIIARIKKKSQKIFPALNTTAVAIAMMLQKHYICKPIYGADSALLRLLLHLPNSVNSTTITALLASSSIPFVNYILNSSVRKEKGGIKL